MKPKRFDTAEDLEKKCIEYFNWCDEKEKPYTVPGLSYFLGYSTRQSIWDLKQDPIYTFEINRALLVIHMQRNEMLLTGNVKSVAGSIFDLKNNFGWKDKTEIEQTIKSSLDVLLDTVDKRKKDD